MELPLRRMDGDPCARCAMPFEGQGALCPTCHDAVEADAWGAEIEQVNRNAYRAGAPGAWALGFTPTADERAERAQALAALPSDIWL